MKQKQLEVWLGALVLAAGLTACGGGAATTSPGTAGATGTAGAPDDAGTAGAPGDGAAADDGAAGDVATSADGATCTALVEQHTEEGTRAHVACTPPPTYGTKPPSSGNHYPTWADYQTYPTPVPWGHLMHSLEHGAVILVYNCPGGCPDEVARAQAFIDSVPVVDAQAPVGALATGVVDSTCTAPTKRRLILVPDPTLDVRWAATAWTWTLRASCFDEVAFGAFVKSHYGQTIENFCDEIHPTFCALQ